MDAPSRRIVYLDTNHWYALGRAMAGHPDLPEHVAVLEHLREQAFQGGLMFPLSSVHYMELGENPRDQHRKEAADVMMALSQLNTMAPPGRILDEELAQELNRRFARPGFPIKVQKFGYGVAFALTGRGKLSGRVTGGTEEDRRELEAKLGKPIAQWEAEINFWTEYQLLKGPEAAYRDQIPGYDPYAARALADEELKSFNVMVDTIHNNPDVKARPLDAICARQFMEFLRNFSRALQDAGFVVDQSAFRDKEDMTDFLMSLPSRRVACMLQLHYLKNTNKHWKINDLRDNAALSEAIPYCDVVVTDSEVWDLAVNRAHLDSEFNTQIFRKLTDLGAYLGQTA